MKRKGMPSLSDTGRRYLDQTRGARLQSPGLEKFVPERNRTPGLVITAVLIVAAMVGAMVWLSRAG
ncbi:MAG TPA: hypothetical protein VEB43_02695 [Anaeromyxobacter sp.]|nr:hypothetical protein [Anaeromyxobacter sp.]